MSIRASQYVIAKTGILLRPYLSVDSINKYQEGVKVKKIISLLTFSALSWLLVLSGCATHTRQMLTSPDGTLSVRVFETQSNTLAYSVARGGEPVILNSPLGLELASADFTQNVHIKSASAITEVTDSYRIWTGKKRRVEYTAHEQTFSVANDRQQKLLVTFRVSNDGVAFRYTVNDPALGEKQFVEEATGFRFSPDTRAWLQPIAEAQVGWMRASPSYEEYYEMEIPVGTESTLGFGWVFPALFKTGNTWILISETGLNENWHGSRLHHKSDNGLYKVATPDPREVVPGGAYLASAKEELVSPWRIIAIGDLATVMESTLGTDVVEPASVASTDYIRPGLASWSWPILKDEFTTFDVQKTFVDYAADMQWEYTLVDAEWDKRIGYEKLAELADYAAQKNVGILVWYNSAGGWNDTPQTPRDKLLTHEQRVAEFSRLRDIGVKGIKVDFFGGDGQSMIAYYLGILKDAAEYELLVNFHGATLPRGWQRTYPNLVTVEAIRGFEYATFAQEFENHLPRHAVMSLFARNVFDPMDFTPMVFGDIPNVERVTENSFQLALPVLMTSGIQHFAAIPEGMATVPHYVRDFLRELPREWDDVKFITGYPGKNVVLARRAGDAWYVAGINADSEDLTLTLDLSFIGDRTGVLIASGEGERQFSQAEIDSVSPLSVTMRTNAGFVAVFK